jgi:hypothetical protein
VPLLWLFGGLVTGSRVLFLRDMLATYGPDYAFLARALDEGVWPLWNPHLHAGLPFLKVYPIDLVLVKLLGAQGALALGVVAHLYLAMCGMTTLARREGASTRAGWLAGVVYGLGGVTLSMVTLVQLLQAAAWAPWVVAAFLGWLRAPAWPRAAVLAMACALLLSTLSVEIALQTAIVGLVLAARRAPLPTRQQAAQLAAAAGLALLMAAPVLAGLAHLLAGTRRSGGFDRAEVLALSASGPLFLEAFVPRLFGGPLWYADVSWAHRYFPGGVPYFLTAYLGAGVLGLALVGRSARLWAAVALGALLALGENGPFAGVLALLSAVRFPVKYLFLCAFGLSLLAGRGLDRLAADRSRARWVAALPPGLLLLAGLALRLAPAAACAAGAALLGAASGPACATLWPEAWLVSGVLATAAVLLAGTRFAGFTAPLLALELVIVNGPINPTAPRAFLDLGPEVRALVDGVLAQPGPPRVFSYGVALAPGERWELPPGNRLVALHWLMRQSLVPPIHAIDGLDGSLDVARVGWEPAGSTVALGEIKPDRFPLHARDLRLAGVRYVLSFAPLAGEGVVPAGQARLGEGVRPLLVHELRDAVPRAYWVPSCESVASREEADARVHAEGFDPRRLVVIEGEGPCAPSTAAPGAESRVAYQRLGPHVVRVDADTPPGWIVVVDSHHPDWRATSGAEAVPVSRANGRYRAVRTPGGARSFEFRFRPAWRAPALAVAALGLLASAAIALGPGRRRAGGPPPDQMRSSTS